jgi:hypothetical protein
MKERDSRFLPQLQPLPALRTYSDPVREVEPQPETQKSFFTSDLEQLLEKPRNAPTPSTRRGVAYCASCGRLGGGCRPVVRDVEESAISKQKSSWGGPDREFVAPEARGEVPRRSWE